MGRMIAVAAGFAAMIMSGSAGAQLYDYSLTTVGGSYLDPYPNNSPVAVSGPISINWQIDAATMNVFTYNPAEPDYAAHAQNVTITANGVTLPYITSNDNLDVYGDRLLLNWKGYSAFDLRANGPIGFDGVTALTDVPLIASGMASLEANSGSGVRRFQFASGSTFLFSFAPNAAAVPEPATWAMMILGFGLAGFAMRRRGSAYTLNRNSITSPSCTT